MLGWSYYGDRSAEYLFGPKAIPIYRWLFIIAITIGAVGGLRVIWSLADISTALMAIPNLIGLILLSGVAAAETKKNKTKLKNGEFKTK